MKYRLLLFVYVACCIAVCMPRGYGQMDIQIQCHQRQFDSVKIRAYDKRNAFKTLYTQPFREKTGFKSKTPLAPGIYWIFGDSTMLEAFIVSSNEGQKFTILIDTTEVTYHNSPENSANHQYIKEIQKFDQQSEFLNMEFQKAQSGSIPSYMMQVFVDSLTAEALRIAADKEAYQRQTIRENPETLLASIIQATIAIPEPPRDLYGDRSQMQAYILQHFFDNFPWHDPRVFQTPVINNKIADYATFIYQLDRPDLDTFVVAACKAAKINRQSYYHFFDRLEEYIGNNVSPFKVEHTYIRMLKDALAIPDLESSRQARYKRELQFIDINLQDSIVPNFNIVLSNGDTTNLYAVHSDYMILYLEHPTCSTCITARNRMADFPVLNNAISNGTLKVLTIYFENDSTVWNTYITHNANPDYLHGWNYDQTIEKKGLFDTRTIPYMFLLDKDKRVIKKDLLINEIEDYLRQLNIQ